MTGTDSAGTVEDGSFESALTGGSHSHLSKSNQAEIKRRALQARPQTSDNQQAADAAFLRIIEQLNADALERPLYTHGVSVTAVSGAATFLYSGRSHDDDLDQTLEHNAA